MSSKKKTIMEEANILYLAVAAEYILKKFDIEYVEKRLKQMHPIQMWIHWIQFLIIECTVFAERYTLINFQNILTLFLRKYFVKIEMFLKKLLAIECMIISNYFGQIPQPEIIHPKKKLLWLIYNWLHKFKLWIKQ